ncbi:hypothetical protein DSO57_1028814 [Entomophthora muscae]|uniref:Uncharacterized protein n=1 Tax=Entomophthora muscae TaxID=34485 RepID=A0ACC2S3P5_9FUNG|nr:hypothetical protein DSO57_1028814 [Entomophthora muscae]
MTMLRTNLYKFISATSRHQTHIGWDFFTRNLAKRKSFHSCCSKSLPSKAKRNYPFISGSLFLVSCPVLSIWVYDRISNYFQEKSRLNHLSELEIVKELEKEKRYLSEPEVTGYKQIPRYFSSEVRKEFSNQGSLTQATFRGPFRVPFPPSVYYHEALKQSVEVCFIGNQLSDENGNIHEGALTSLLDESFARVAFQQFRTPHMFTANLSIRFKHQLSENSYFKIVTKLASKAEQKSYKAILEARILDLSEKEIATATAVFLVPKTLRDTIGSIAE